MNKCTHTNHGKLGKSDGCRSPPRIKTCMHLQHILFMRWATTFIGIAKEQWRDRRGKAPLNSQLPASSRSYFWTKFWSRRRRTSERIWTQPSGRTRAMFSGKPRKPVVGRLLDARCSERLCSSRQVSNGFHRRNGRYSSLQHRYLQYRSLVFGTKIQVSTLRKM